MDYENLKEIERRPQRYWNADGLPDLAMGALWLLWGVTLALPGVLPEGKWRSYYSMMVPAILIAGAVLQNQIVKRLKQRLTFPRTGYVDWPEPPAAMKILACLLAAGIAAAIAFLALARQSRPLGDLAAPAFGSLLALSFLVTAVWRKLPHYLSLAAASLVLALFIGRMGLRLEQGMILLFVCIGATSMTLGGIRLRSYLRQNPRPEEEHR